MEFGIGIPTSGDSWKVAQRAEELGFSHVWFYDTQMLVGDPFVAMGAAALKTSRIRLGTGVLVPSNRIPAVTASAFATLNAMAPGRIDFGVGTGFSYHVGVGFGAFAPYLIGVLQDAGTRLETAMLWCIMSGGMFVIALLWLGPETKGTELS